MPEASHHIAINPIAMTGTERDFAMNPIAMTGTERKFAMMSTERDFAITAQEELLRYEHRAGVSNDEL